MIYLVAAIDWSLTVAVCALVVTVFALYIAVVEVRRNNVPILSVRKCQCTFRDSIYENNQKLFAHFEIVIQNKGVTLTDPVVRLGFVDTDGCGGTSISLMEFEEIRGTQREFERSMIAAFGWKSYKLQPFQVPMFLSLNDPGKQRATFRVYSQSYLAYQFRIGNWLDRLKRLWNAIAFRVQWPFRRTIKANDGSDRLYIPEWLPTFVTLEWQLIQLVEHLKKQNQPESSH